jgi:hypothetical protein
VQDLKTGSAVPFSNPLPAARIPNNASVEKISVSSARLFGYSVQGCGRGARMWKFDMVDAYKTVPAAQQDLRLQGFSWLRKFFI